MKVICANLRAQNPVLHLLTNPRRSTSQMHIAGFYRCPWIAFVDAGRSLCRGPEKIEEIEGVAQMSDGGGK